MGRSWDPDERKAVTANHILLELLSATSEKQELMHICTYEHTYSHCRTYIKHYVFFLKQFLSGSP
jgi:hypothetical protein